MNRVLRLTGIFLLLAISSRAIAGEEYYMLIFGSQRIPPNPNYSHSWGTFIKVSWDGNGPRPPGAKMEVHTISWMPANMKIRTGALSPEPGVNLDIHASLEYATSTEQRVSLCGPYPIRADLYDRAIARRIELEGGAIRYKANDMGYTSDKVTNCIHAVSTVAEGPKLRVASPGWGQSASYFVLLDMEPWILSKEPVPWVGSAIGLDKYPIIYRDYRNPNSARLIGGVFRALGGELGLQATYGPPPR